MSAYSDIYEQYVDDASFLWILRTIVIDQPHYTKKDMLELEERINAHIQGLMVSTDEAWIACEKALDLKEPGEVFVAAVVAFGCNNALMIQKTLDIGLTSDETFKALVSALGWLPGDLVNPWVKKLLLSKKLNHKYLALAVCSVRRENPADYLNTILSRADCRQHKKLYARALRLIGELKRKDLMPFLNEALESNDYNIKFWACWSLILLGKTEIVTLLEPYIFNISKHQMRAINIALRVLPIDQARAIISNLSDDTEQVRTTIKAVGILGEPHAINWLILKMQEPALSKLAAESFALITGYNLERHKLEQNTPVHSYAYSEEDENLHWPDHQKVTKFWSEKNQDFMPGQRYFMGHHITADVLNESVQTGSQRQRHAAALELALNSPVLLLQNTKACVLDMAE